MTPRVFQALPGGGYELSLPGDAVRVEVRHLRRERHQLIGEVDVICRWPGAQTFPDSHSLSCADLNLSSQSARDARGKYCAKRAQGRSDDFDWIGLIDEVSRRVIEAERNGTDAIVLDDAPQGEPPRDFTVHGLSIPADSHSQVVTDGGGLKSLIILLILGEMAKRGVPVAFLDWEWNAARHLARKRRLFGLDRLDSLFYLRCRNSLSVERDHIRRFCEQRSIRFIGIDSIGAACDGKLNDDDVARAYNRALDELPPSLAAAHIPKTQVEPGADLKAFGSAFFHNYARMTWSLRKKVGDSDDIVTVSLTPSRQNDGARLQPVGLEFTFSPERIAVRGVDLVSVPGLSNSLPLRSRMIAALRQGACSIEALSKELDAKKNSIEQVLSRDKGETFTKIPNTNGFIGLLQKGTDRCH